MTAKLATGGLLLMVFGLARVSGQNYACDDSNVYRPSCPGGFATSGGVILRCNYPPNPVDTCTLERCCAPTTCKVFIATSPFSCNTDATMTDSPCIVGKAGVGGCNELTCCKKSCASYVLTALPEGCPDKGDVSGKMCSGSAPSAPDLCSPGFCCIPKASTTTAATTTAAATTTTAAATTTTAATTEPGTTTATPIVSSTTVIPIVPATTTQAPGTTVVVVATSIITIVQTGVSSSAPIVVYERKTCAAAGVLCPFGFNSGFKQCIVTSVNGAVTASTCTSEFCCRRSNNFHPIFKYPRCKGAMVRCPRHSSYLYDPAGLTMPCTQTYVGGKIVSSNCNVAACCYAVVVRPPKPVIVPITVVAPPSTYGGFIPCNKKVKCKLYRKDSKTKGVRRCKTSKRTSMPCTVAYCCI